MRLMDSHDIHRGRYACMTLDGSCKEEGSIIEAYDNIPTFFIRCIFGAAQGLPTCNKLSIFHSVGWSEAANMYFHSHIRYNVISI